MYNSLWLSSIVLYCLLYRLWTLISHGEAQSTTVLPSNVPQTQWSFIVLHSRTAACAGDHRMRTHIVGWDGLLEWVASDIETYVLLPSASCTDHQVLVKHQFL